MLARAGDVAVVGSYDGVRSHVPVETVREACALVRAVEADGLVGLGGGSSIDTCKAVVAALAEDGEEALPRIVAIPTTYAGAEWTPFFGMLLEPGTKSGGSDSRATPIAAIYDPELTVDLPLDVTVGTAMNALAHCAEAYYHPARTARAERHADTGATAIGHALPLVVSKPHRDLRAHPPARGRLPGGARPRGLGSLPRACDGAGARGPVRPAAGCDERDLPARCAAVQRGGRPGGDRAVR